MCPRNRILAWLVACLLPLSSASAEDIVIFAAASTKTALDGVVQAFAGVGEHRVIVSYAGSSVLARQIELGAPVDIFLSANTDWMDYLEARGRVETASRFDLLSNRLVLIGHADTTHAQPQTPGAPFPNIAEMIDGGRLAMGLVDSVPAGIYGKAALLKLGQWEAVAPYVAQSDNVRAALALVATGAAPLGIVYASDVQAEPRVRLVAEFPEDSHPPIRYPVALIAPNSEPSADFLEFLKSDTARALFEAQGFTMVEN